MTVESLDLTDYVAIAAEVTGFGAATVIKTADLDLAIQPARMAAGFIGPTWSTG